MSSSLAASALEAATSAVDLGRLVTRTGAVRTLDRKLIGSVNKAGARRPRILGTGFTGTGIGSAEVPAAEDVSEAEAASAAAEPRSLSAGVSEAEAASAAVEPRSLSASGSEASAA